MHLIKINVCLVSQQKQAVLKHTWVRTDGNMIKIL